jgi:hypothetical protein
MINRLPFFVKIVSLSVVVAVVLFNFYQTVFEVKPFWLDEWYIIDNLKSKTGQQLWGPLNHIQQFPRAYLWLVKQFTETFNYSYVSLRFFPFLAGTASVLLVMHLGKLIFGKDNLHRYLFVLLFVSFHTAIRYFVQTKQYTMEMFLMAAGLWQLIIFHRFFHGGSNKVHYSLSCLILAVAPFFSYTYPMVATPIAGSLFFELMTRWMEKRRKDVGFLLLPLLAFVAGVGVAFWTDIRHVISHQQQLSAFGFNLPQGSLNDLFNVYNMISHLGSGMVFEILFTLLILLGTGRQIQQWSRNRRSLNLFSDERYVYSYALQLILVAIALYLAGKLPMGEYRLNAFLTLALSLLLIQGLQTFAARAASWQKAGLVLTLGIWLASIGNIVISYLDIYRGADVANYDIGIYRNVSAAIEEAYKTNLPLITLPGIASTQFEKENTHSDWILKTNPRYHIYQPLPVFGALNPEDAVKVLADNKLNKAILVEKYTYRIIQP